MGKLNWANMNNWTAEVRAQADNFKVDIPSMAKLKVSPNVVVKASPKLLDLSGNVIFHGQELPLKACRIMPSL